MTEEAKRSARQLFRVEAYYVCTVKKMTVPLVLAGREIGLEENAEKT